MGCCGRLLPELGDTVGEVQVVVVSDAQKAALRDQREAAVHERALEDEQPAHRQQASRQQDQRVPLAKAAAQRTPPRAPLW